MKIFLLLLNLSLCTYAFAIVTIKPIDIKEHPVGFSGELSFNWNLNRGNSDIDTTDAAVYIQYDMNNSLAFIKSSYSYGESAGTENLNKSFIHFRHIHKLSQHFDNELFIQQQSDAFQALTSRTLGGLGLRSHAGDPKKSGRIYFGFGAFLLTEKEILKEEDSYARSNVYISYKYSPRKNYTLAFVSYYQPRTDDSSDYLQLSTAELNLAVNKQFSIRFSLEYNVNSRPEPTVRAYDYTQKTALKYTF